MNIIPENVRALRKNKAGYKHRKWQRDDQGVGGEEARVGGGSTGSVGWPGKASLALWLEICVNRAVRHVSIQEKNLSAQGEQQVV